MLTTPNYELKKIELTDSPPDISVLGDSFDIIDTQLKANADAASSANGVIGTLTSLATTAKNNIVAAINELFNSIAAHKADYMPHKFVDGSKTYRWGFRTVDGQPQFIYEEVI